MSTQIWPIELAEANAFIRLHHRHHQPVQGHRFSIGLCDGAKLVGVVVVGRPVARNGGAPNRVVEVTRCCTDGTPMTCSRLYAAAARVAAALGYSRIQTYTLASESGISLKAAGWTDEGEAGGGQWTHTDGRPRRTDQPTEKKRRWAKDIGDHRLHLADKDARHLMKMFSGAEWKRRHLAEAAS
ncbi:MAG TPA: XF1762 family protein [bacterium]|nr:XF1762 family protein [bacterium]